jgi:aminoglycoside N3'-acetyltransferase
LGVESGETIILHSSLLNLGRLEEYDMRSAAEVIIDLILDRIGPNGTLSLLAPFYDYADKQVPFDTAISPVSHLVGVLNVCLASRPESERSANPLFSVASIGAQADFICNQSSTGAVGALSAWGQLTALNARMLHMGSSLERTTIIRHVESLFGVPYLYTKLFTTPVTREGVPVQTPITALLRYKNVPINYDLHDLWNLARNQGLVTQHSLGGSNVTSISVQPFVDLCLQALNENVYAFLEKAPPYIDDQLPLI